MSVATYVNVCGAMYLLLLYNPYAVTYEELSATNKNISTTNKVAFSASSSDIDMADNSTNYEVKSNGVYTSNTAAANEVETSVDVNIHMSNEVESKSVTSKIILATNNTYMYVYSYQIYTYH